MKEYFVFATSCAAPVVSDESSRFVKGETPREALERFVREYNHPCGLFCASLYESADAYHKDHNCWLLRWQSPASLQQSRIRGVIVSGGAS